MASKIKPKKKTSQKDKTQYNKYLREKGKKNSERIGELKNKPCADCGNIYPPCAMDFDHVKGEKLYNVGSMAYSTCSWDLIIAEIEKCDLVCANCHRIRSYTRKQLASRMK